MTLIEQIKAAHLTARKNRDTTKATFISTLLSECQKPGKDAGRESTDVEVTDTLNKFVKNIQFTIHHTPLTQVEILTLLRGELTVVEQFLPTQLDEKTLIGVIADIVSEIGNNKGLVMKALKEKHHGTYSGSQASRIFDQSAKV